MGISLCLSITRRSRAKVVKTLPFLSKSWVTSIGDQEPPSASTRGTWIAAATAGMAPTSSAASAGQTQRSSRREERVGGTTGGRRSERGSYSIERDYRAARACDRKGPGDPPGPGDLMEPPRVEPAPPPASPFNPQVRPKAGGCPKPLIFGCLGLLVLGGLGILGFFFYVGTHVGQLLQFSLRQSGTAIPQQLPTGGTQE